MSRFTNITNFAPTHEVEDVDTSGGNANGGLALGGPGGDADGGDGGDATQAGLLNLNLLSDVEGGEGGDGGRAGDGGNASADGGRAGDGGNVQANQYNTLEQDYEFENSFNEDNSTTTTVINDSFKEDNDVFYANRSFNEDNDGVDNAGGYIRDSIVAGDDVEDSGNSETDVEIDESFNTDNSRTNIDASDDDEFELDIEDSFNREDNDFLDLDVLNDLTL
jgi:hypothetical protein